MKIDILCSDGSPLGVGLSSVGGDAYRVGVGGAELALLSMCEVWHNIGHTVRLYNDPHEAVTSPFEQFPVNAFTPSDDREIVIVFRSPNPRIVAANGLKVWWSTDQYTRGSFRDFAPMVDKIVCISDFHKNYFLDKYGIKGVAVIDLPVRLPDYEQKIEKVKNRFIFTSVPDRGLNNLWRIWPKILKAVPDASLVITSDYRLWGCMAGQNDQHIARWIVRDNIEFLGCVNRSKLVEEQLKAEFHLYPCNYDELFCIAVAESQVAGAFPITSSKGALPTTNMGSVLYVNADDPRHDKDFVSIAVGLIENRETYKNNIEDMQTKALQRFDPLVINTIWEDKVFK